MLSYLLKDSIHQIGSKNSPTGNQTIICLFEKYLKLNIDKNWRRCCEITHTIIIYQILFCLHTVLSESNATEIEITDLYLHFNNNNNKNVC